MIDNDEHPGTISRYVNHKCRCDKCREAWRVYSAKRKAERALQSKDPSDIRHGTYMFYTNHGCRCEYCIAANTENARHKREIAIKLGNKNGPHEDGNLHMGLTLKST